MQTKIKPATSRPQKAGYTWVADRRAKNGGYWRKLKAGFKARGLISKLITGVAIAGGGAVATQVMRKKASRATMKLPKVPPDLSGTAEAEADALRLKKLKKRNTAIALGVYGATNAALIASDIAKIKAKKKQYQAYTEARRKAQETASGYSSNGASEASSEPSRSWHEALGVEPDASPSEVKKAYRKAAKEYHPDVNKSPEAEQRMKELNNAYEKAKRRRRDSLYWEDINAAYRQAWRAYPFVDVRFWVTNL